MNFKNIETSSNDIQLRKLTDIISNEIKNVSYTLKNEGKRFNLNSKIDHIDIENIVTQQKILDNFSGLLGNYFWIIMPITGESGVRHFIKEYDYKSLMKTHECEIILGRFELENEVKNIEQYLDRLVDDTFYAFIMDKDKKSSLINYINIGLKHDENKVIIPIILSNGVTLLFFSKIICNYMKKQYEFFNMLAGELYKTYPMTEVSTLVHSERIDERNRVDSKNVRRLM